MTAIDHLILATPDLDQTVTWLETLTGVQPAYGGSHPAAGTRNFLLGLGDSAYLEVIGRDPAQPVPPAALPFGLGTLAEPRLSTWALRVKDVDARVSAARTRGYDPGPAATKSRADPSGRVVSGRITPPRNGVADGLLPFLIDWGSTPHPAADLPEVPLVSLVGYHPDPEPLRSRLGALGAPLEVRLGSRPTLAAVLRTTRGEVTLV